MSSNLSQDEIQLLLRMQQGEERLNDTASAADARVQKLDLTANEERIYRGRLPGLETIFERFCRNLRPALTKHLNRNTHCTLGELETVKFGRFLKKLPLPANLHVFRMPPLPSQALLFLSTPLAFALVEALLGGKGKKQIKIEAREFSPIESRLLGKIVVSLLEELQAAWSAVDAVHCVYARSEYNPLAVSLVPSTDNVVLVNAELSIEETSAPLIFCLPAVMLQPLRERLASGLQTSRIEHDGDGTGRLRMEAHLRKTECEVRVRLAEGSIKVRELLSLGAGDILPLDTPATAPAKVLVEGQEKFSGTAGVSRGSKAVVIR